MIIKYTMCSKTNPPLRTAKKAQSEHQRGHNIDHSINFVLKYLFEQYGSFVVPVYQE